MDSLQPGLALAGGAILLGIIAYNAWVVRRNTPRQAERLEPEGPPESGEAADPALDAASLPAAPPVQGRLDERIDSIIPIALDAPVSGEELMARLPATHRIGSKPFAIEAHHRMTGKWEPPQHGWLYDACRAGVQLANRAGALTQVEFSEFVIKTQAFADAIGGAADSPDMLQEVARAKELDKFASEHDMQLVLDLRARATPWSLGFVNQQAAKLGFVAGAVAGRMVLPSPKAGMPHLVELSYDPQIALSDNKDNIPLHQIALSLDVPQVAPEENAFDSLLQAASALAQAMDGIITDPAGHALSEQAMSEIRAGLRTFYKALVKHKLPAGSPVARRLFS